MIRVGMVCRLYKQRVAKDHLSLQMHKMDYLLFDLMDQMILSRFRALKINQAYTVYSAAKTTAGSARDYLFDGVTTNSARSLIALRNSGTVQFWAGNWANTSITSPTGFFTLSAVFDNTSSLLSLNGTTVTGKILVLIV